MIPGQIVMINGASSSGKTSIVRAFQDISPVPYLYAGIDSFIRMLPDRYLDRPLWDEILGLQAQSGEIGRRLMSGMHHAIAALSLAGNNVIADHVLVEPEWLMECATLFCELPALFVGVYCPLSTLEVRERTRGDRTPGRAKAQSKVVHSQSIYDLEIDSSVMTPGESAAKVRERLDNGVPFHAFGQLALKYSDC